tara:strand:- start:1126 stop:3246 length:2121 start_codon:yes stop_codon:yes gene_type:complete
MGGTHEGSDAMRFISFLNNIKENNGITNIKVENYGHSSLDLPYSLSKISFDICAPEGLFPPMSIESLKKHLNHLLRMEIKKGGNYYDLHRCIDTLAEGDEPNENWWKEAKTFNAPYAGAGALMPIKGDTSLSSFSGKELAESSAIHGDFNQASLNYSGHQNLEVRGAEDWTPTQCADCGRYEENEDDYIGYCSRCGVNRCYDNCIPNATYLYELEMGESSDGEYLVCENCITDEEYVAFGKRMNWFAESFNADFTVAMDTVSEAGFRIHFDDEGNMTDDELKEYALKEVKAGRGPDYWIEGDGEEETLRITEMTREYPYEPDLEAESFGAESEIDRYNKHMDEILEVKARLLEENIEDYDPNDPEQEAENDAIYEVFSKYYPDIYGAESFCGADLAGRVVNIVGVEDKVYVTIRFSDEHYGIQKIFVGEMEDVMLAESFGADSQPIYERKYRQIVVDDNFKNKLKTLESLIKSLNEAIQGGRFDVVETEALRRAVSEVYSARDILMGGYWESESFGAESNGDQVKLFYEGIYYNDDEDDEREGKAIESHSLVSKQEYIDYYHDTEYNPCECNVQGCLSCFLDETSHTPAIKNGGVKMLNVLWFEDAELNALDAESFGAEYGKRQRFGNRYVARDTKGKFISNVSVGRSLKADRRNKSKTPARSGFGHKGDARKGASGEFKLPTDAKSLVGIGAVLGGLWAYLESKA